MNHDTDNTEFKHGLMFAVGAYSLWGLLPIYWKQLQQVPAIEILAHRMVWSLGFMLLLLAFKQRWAWVRALDRRTVFTYLTAGLLVATNWGLYIWAVTSGYVVETALGYFINPLINVVLGAAVLGERPRVGQWTAIAVAATGVLYLTFAYGELPWISLALAFSFALYGLIKKQARLGAIEGLTVETALLFLPALGYLLWRQSTGIGALGQVDGASTALLLFSGVATALPLVFFTAAVRRLTLTAIGVMQYSAPTIQFLLGVYLYNEAFDSTRLIGFVFIWSGLVLFTLEGLRHRRRRRSAGALVAPTLGG